jgi:hypothetical protein
MCSLLLKFANDSDFVFPSSHHNHHLYQISDSETPSCCSFLHHRSPLPQPPTAPTCSHPTLTPLQDASSGGGEMGAAAGAEPAASMPVPLEAAAKPEVAPDSLDFSCLGEFSLRILCSIHPRPHAGFVKAVLSVHIRHISFIDWLWIIMLLRHCHHNFSLYCLFVAASSSSASSTSLDFLELLLRRC